MEALDRNLFNIDLLLLNEENTKLFREVKTGAIFETGSKIFHKDGLFSTEIFGPLGSAVRSEREAVINLRLPTMHPLVFETLCSINSKILAIAESKLYVKFNSQLGDFELSTREKGETGYTYLLKHIDKLKFKETDSTQRTYKITLCKKYCNTKSLITKWCVIPAGIRDYTEDKKGMPTEDEINGIYRKLISTSNMLMTTPMTDDNLKLLDPIRYRIQRILVEIYQYIKSLVDGKSKFIQSKFTKRATMYGTRNVLTPSPAKITDLTDENRLKTNHTTVGLYQYIKAISPITMNLLQSKFLNKIFNPNSNTALLVNSKTMKSELMDIDIRIRDKWLSMDGINDIMNKMAQPIVRKEPVKIGKHYLLAVLDQGTKLEVISDTKEFERRGDNFDLSKLRPITYGELFYLAIEDVIKKYPAFNTRYPVAGLGGIYPSWVYVKTTVSGRKVEVTYNGVTKTLYEYPKKNDGWFESMSVDSSHIAKLGADPFFTPILNQVRYL